MRKNYYAFLCGLFSLVYWECRLFCIAESWMPVKSIIGFVEDPDHCDLNDKNKLKDYQFRYEGFSCRSDQSGSYRFSCENQTLADPVFILISNGIFWAEQLDAIGDKAFSRHILKHDPKKKYLLFKAHFFAGNFLLDRVDLSSMGYELPMMRTLIFNINPDYVDDYVSYDSRHIFHQDVLMLPTIRLKSAKDTVFKNKVLGRQNNVHHSSLFKAKHRLKSKTAWRKWKHSRYYKELEIHQTIRSANPFKPSPGVLVSYVKPE